MMSHGGEGMNLCFVVPAAQLLLVAMLKDIRDDWKKNDALASMF